MSKEQLIIAAFDARAKRREERRHFFKLAGGTAAALTTATLLTACGGGGNDGIPVATTPTPPAQVTLGDPDVLNFALNLEYLEAQFYSYAVTGDGLPGNLLDGTGTRGAVMGGRKVTFTDPIVQQYANEIQQDEVNHVAFLRTALGTAAVAQPAIDVSVSATSAFSMAAQAAGLVPAGQAFDPYANDENFLLGAFIFEDVGVTAYKGAAPLITNKTYLEAAAGILAAEAYHAGLIRTILYRKGLDTPSLRTSTEAISTARDSLDGGNDLDQGIAMIGDQSNIVPTDADGIAFSRSTGQVLNIVYLTHLAASSGGFFPSGVNGTVRMSAAN